MRTSSSSKLTKNDRYRFEEEGAGKSNYVQTTCSTEDEYNPSANNTTPQSII